MQEATTPPRIFVSHSSKDDAFGTRLVDDLRRVLGDEQAVWYDSHGGLQGGDSIWRKIMKEIRARNVFIVILSPDAMASEWVHDEINQAWQQKNERGGVSKLILPLLYRPCDNEMREDLNTLRMISFAWPRSYDVAFAELLQALQIQNTSPATTTPDSAPPRLKSSTYRNELVPLVWNIPYRRNSFFTGRKDLLSHLRDELSKNRPTALNQAQAISGLGGIGKTQTAIEYAYRYRERYRYGFWMRASSRDVLLSEFVILASLLQLPEQQEKKDPHLLVAAIQRWLSTHQQWLLILDNADDLAMVDEFLPHADTGHILLTTRAQAGGGIANTIEVEKMDVQDGALLLLRRAKLIRPGDTTEKADIKHRTAAEAVARELDGLPLALDQAGAYIEETQCSLTSFLELYRKRRLDLLGRRGNLPSDHPESVRATWSLSFQRVEQAYPAAAELLRLCAFLDPDAIPEELFSEGASELGPVLEPVAADPYLLNEAIAELRNYSLMRRDEEERAVSIHRLVQAVLKEEMGEETHRQWAERTVRAVARAFPAVELDVDTMQQCQRYYPQGRACAELIAQYTFTFEEAAGLLDKTAHYLRERGLYTEAEPLYNQTLAIREKTLGPEHPNTAISLNNLAWLYRDQGRFKQAEALFQRTLDIHEDVLGPEHLSTATSLHGLAWLYRDRGKYEKAEVLLQRDLAIHEQVLGPEHPRTATTLNDLAALHHDQGKYEEAEELFERALSIREKVLEPEHRDLATSLNDLAALYHDQGKYEQSEALFRRAVLIREQVLGPEHPRTATSLNDLATLYHDSGKYEEAELLFKRALEIRKKVLEPEHPDIATSLNDLAAFYRDQGKYEEAEPLFKRALEIREQVLGSEHPRTAIVLNNLASLYHRQGKYEEAEPLFKRALEIREKTFCPEHLFTGDILERYAGMLRAMKRE